MRTNFQSQKGQSLFEVVVAIAISALVITVIVSLATNSIQNSSFSRDKTLASNYVQEVNEWLRKERDNGASTFVAHAQTPTWCFRGTSWSKPGTCSSTDYVQVNGQNTNFIRQSAFTVNLLNGKNIIHIDTVVSWQDSKGSHQINGSTDLSIL